MGIFVLRSHLFVSFKIKLMNITRTFPVTITHGHRVG